MAGATLNSGHDAELWRAIGTAGIILVVFGAAALVYSVYAWASRPAAALHYPAGPYGVQALNQSGFNQSGLNLTAPGSEAHGFAAELAYVEGASIGILMVLLGITAHAYSRLRIGAGRR